MRVTRRDFGRTMGTALGSAQMLGVALAQDPPSITAAQVVERIQKQLAAEGVVWRQSAFDGYHVGGPNSRLTGIATTFQSSFSVLKRAAEAKKNLIVTHESTFWDGFDPIEVMRNDPVYLAKTRFAEQNNLVVWRIHDHWHRRRPDPIFTGLARKLGWTSYYDATIQPRRYTIPEMPLENVARHIQTSLGTKNVVVVGNPNLPVKTIGDCAHVLSSVLPTLRVCDVALVGETPMHDTFEYVRDAMSLGLAKGVVMISHEGLEEWGMEECARWLKPLVPELPVVWIPAGDPFQTLTET